MAADRVLLPPPPPPAAAAVGKSEARCCSRFDTAASPAPRQQSSSTSNSSSRQSRSSHKAIRHLAQLMRERRVCRQRLHCHQRASQRAGGASLRSLLRLHNMSCTHAPQWLAWLCCATSARTGVGCAALGDMSCTRAPQNSPVVAADVMARSMSPSAAAYSLSLLVDSASCCCSCCRLCTHTTHRPTTERASGP